MFKVTIAKAVAGLAVAGTMALTVGTATPASAAGFGQMRSVMNNKCAEVLSWNNNNGAPAGMWDCHGGANQRWDIIPGQWGMFSLKNSNGKCLEILSWKNTNGARAGMWDCHGGNNQMWNVSGASTFGALQIRSAMNGKCLELLSWNNNNGAPIGMWDCHGGANQQWFGTI